MREPGPETTGAVQATSATRTTLASSALDADEYCASMEGIRFVVGPGVKRTLRCRPYERGEGDPLYRPLKVFTLDPAESRLRGSVAVLNVPYEPLVPGPVGGVFEVDDFDGTYRYVAVDLDNPKLLLQDGAQPSASRHNPEFHQQMVYAVCSVVYSTFRTALGRHVSWGFNEDAGHERLKLRPHAFAEANAFYDKTAGELQFGYYEAGNKAFGRNLERGLVYTCLSHDIVVHEISHALIDGLRAHMTEPTSLDVLALHEAIADLVAIFQRFSYRSVLEIAIRESRGELASAELLVGLARQFGHTTGSTSPLRSIVDPVSSSGDPLTYAKSTTPHDRGSVLAAAVFSAFVTVFHRKVSRYVRLATGGTGVLPPGELPELLIPVLAEEASKIASHFLSICIRAIDYCPPVDVTFGDYLRALITADSALVPDDTWGYREAFIDAFRARDIHPRDVDSLSEDALLWRSPRQQLGQVEPLSFAKLRFEGDPSMAAGAEELYRQACALGEFMTRSHVQREFGLAVAADPELEGDGVELPVVDSIRSTRRVGPQGQVVFDLVAEVTQVRHIRTSRGPAPFFGGCTVILDPSGAIRYAISKNLLSPSRLARFRDFVTSDLGSALWSASESKERLEPSPAHFRLIHQGRFGATNGEHGR